MNSPYSNSAARSLTGLGPVGAVSRIVAAFSNRTLPCLTLFLASLFIVASEALLGLCRPSGEELCGLVIDDPC